MAQVCWMPWFSCQHPHSTQDTWTLDHPFHCEALELGVHWLLYQTWAAGAALVPDLMFKFPPMFWPSNIMASRVSCLACCFLSPGTFKKCLLLLAQGKPMLPFFLPGSCVALFSAACLVPHWFSLKTAFTKKNAHSLVKQLLSVMCSRRTVFASGACAGLDCLSWPLPSSK